MIYSVWNQGAGLFDYFEDGRTQDVLNVEKPRHLTSPQKLGATVDQAAWPLPADARPIGSGAHAVGRVASRKRGGGGSLSLGDISSDGFVRAGVLVGVAFLVWQFVVKAPKQRRRA